MPRKEMVEFETFQGRLFGWEPHSTIINVGDCNPATALHMGACPCLTWPHWMGLYMWQFLGLDNMNIIFRNFLDLSCMAYLG